MKIPFLITSLLACSLLTLSIPAAADRVFFSIGTPVIYYGSSYYDNGYNNAFVVNDYDNGYVIYNGPYNYSPGFVAGYYSGGGGHWRHYHHGGNWQRY